ncbi:MAG: hypothetical protein LAP40_02775 [Acidobacteriia bacterium]|nr:hypothetical protein [Terriglobia bacterium]
MRHYCSAAAVAAICVPVLLMSVPAAAQPAKPAAKTAPDKSKAWTPPRTPDGQPNLEGYWTNNTRTPLERPKGLGAKEFYTEAEITDLIAREKSRVAVSEEEGRQTEPGTDADVHYDFAQFGLDPGQTKLSWNRRTSLIIGAQGTLPPMLPEARQRNAALAAKNRGHESDGPENRPLSARCIQLGQESVPLLPGGYNNNLEIVQGRGTVAILHEMNHSARVIPTDGSAHPPDSLRQWRGDPRAHWEGNTLVIDSTNFDPRNPFRGSGDKLHVVERLTPVDPDTILYRFTVEDPTTWDQPWTGELAMTRVEGPIYEFACHEGNYALANTLRGARVAEQEAAAKSTGK